MTIDVGHRHLKEGREREKEIRRAGSFKPFPAIGSHVILLKMKFHTEQ